MTDDFNHEPSDDKEKDGGGVDEHDEHDEHDVTTPLSDPTEACVASSAEAVVPESIGRYRIVRTVGQGAFGRVYLARDGQLDRDVAIKVPHPDLVSAPEQVAVYLSEAKTVANLDHPHIVPVHDAGSSDEFPFYVVSKYVAGQDLKSRLKQSSLTVAEAVQLVATLAEALHHAHTKGFVHRDVKPGNILLDDSGQPFLVDFGLALKEQDLGKGPQYAGTPAYMSPEQARGEGHRVDGRSDIFSLGVVFYELLTGRRPFHGETTSDLLAQIKSQEVKPLRQIDDTIPKEVERICLKALAKRASERYTAALDLADDLRFFLPQVDASKSTNRPTQIAVVETQVDSTKPAQLSDTHDSDRGALKIVPKGLRSFDAHDADFFLELLPGPRDRNGLPDTIRFWKTRIEERDSDETFTVGLIYGPSGCGKSSLVKAGLLPRLSLDVIPVYLEATPDETEHRLLRGLRKACPSLENGLDIQKSLTVIRQGRGIPSGKKVLIILDQFEQWLHAKRHEEAADLVEALRQCDGTHLQCIVMVRDDFWLAASRFAKDLEVRLLEGVNIGLVDLFPVRHARKVLRAFGDAFGALPEDAQMLAKAQESFVKSAVEGLAEDGKVISVRLALFAEMMKGKTWAPEILKQVGGTKGVGVTFLDETFSASTASPEHRFHQNAARKVLKALLPESGTDIKGEMKSDKELLTVSGYGSRRKDFDELLQMLDAELRLITPTDPEGMESEEVDVAEASASPHAKYYQLTHDYLVHSLRDWLTRKQKETRQGRAELALADRASVWNARPENRQLPSLLQWWRIRWYTDSKQWTEPQRKMMNKAARVNGFFWSGVLCLLVIVGIAGQLSRNRIKAETNREKTVNTISSLETATGSEVKYVLDILDSLPREMVVDELNDRFSDATGQAKLSLAYGMSHYEQFEVDAIVAGILDPETASTEASNIVRALSGSTSDPLPKVRAAADLATQQADWPTKTRLAVTAMYLGDSSLAVEMLRGEPEKDKAEQTFDPIQRTRFIKSFAEWPGDLESLAELLREANDRHLCSGIALSLGRIERPSTDAKREWQDILSAWYENASDGGTHSAAEWAMRHWGIPLPETESSSEIPADREWWQADGFTMVRIPAGSVIGEEGAVVVDQDYWLGDREVTVELFKRFMAEAPADERPQDWPGEKDFGVEDNSRHPVQQVSWYDAILFCNWLSDQYDLPRTYEVTRNDNEWDVVLIPEAAGFRLPTEPEWEYACRAKTTTRFSFGDQDTELGDYGWFNGNSGSRTHEIGEKPCNAWGLFDMHGNVWEWCWDLYDSGASHWVNRGGSWLLNAGFCLSSHSRGVQPSRRFLDRGFRVALGPAGQEKSSEAGSGGR